jgi:hypothetical protein
LTEQISKGIQHVISTDEFAKIKVTTPFLFSTARKACEQNVGRCDHLLVEFDGCKQTEFLRPPALSRQGINQQSLSLESRIFNHDSSSSKIFKTKICKKNKLLKKRSRRKSSTKKENQEDGTICNFLTNQESTKITTVIADLESTMHFLGPNQRVRAESSMLVDTLNQQTSLSFFLMNVSENTKIES